MNIQTLIETIGTSVSMAQQGIERHSLEKFFEYFQQPELMANSEGELNEPQGYKPITAKVAMPSGDNISKQTIVDVPLVSLISHRQVQLDKVVVKVKTRLSSDNYGNIEADINVPVSNTANTLDGAEAPVNSEKAEVELVFNVRDSAEGLSRVVQDISKTI